jgi:hypothetical protein
MGASQIVIAEPTAEVDRGRHPGFARHEGFAGGPGSLSLSLATMSLDYPFYAELRRRQHRAAKWWRWGDALYYLGLLPALILAIPALISVLKLPFGRLEKWQIWSLILFAVFVGLFLAGTRLKLKAWTMAAKDGINVNDY